MRIGIDELAQLGVDAQGLARIERGNAERLFAGKR
jgi:hypothetical protein